MRIVCVWRRDSDYGRAMEEWLMEFERRTGQEVETLDPDTRDGVGFCSAYDIVEYPTIIALDNNGAALASWRGAMLPTFDEVIYWLNS